MLVVLKHGKEVGPYSDEEIRTRLLSHRLAITDLARRDAVGEWVPLSHLVNHATLLNTELPKLGGHALVAQFIAVIYIAYNILGIAVFAWLRLSMSPQEWSDQQGKPVGDILSAQLLVLTILNIVSAVMLFRLRRVAFYMFLALYLYGVIATLFSASGYSWRALIDHPMLMAFQGFQIAVICYLGYLNKKRILT